MFSYLTPNGEIPSDSRWNILPGQIALKIDEADIAHYNNVQGFVVQDGLKAVFFADGVLAGELGAGKYPFKDLGVTEVQGAKRFFLRIAAFFSEKARAALQSATTLSIILMHEGEFPLIFVEKDIPTKALRSDVALHVTAKISNIIQFYKNQLLDQKFVRVEKLSSSLETAVRTLLEEKLSTVEAEEIPSNSKLREELLSQLKTSVSDIYPYVSLERIIRLTATNTELDELRRMREELYISEKELVELSKRNDFLNRLNDEKNQQLLHDAQTQADFTAAMNKIDEQNELTADEKAKFADMLYWRENSGKPRMPTKETPPSISLNRTDFCAKKKSALLRPISNRERTLKTSQTVRHLPCSLCRTTSPLTSRNCSGKSKQETAACRTPWTGSACRQPTTTNAAAQKSPWTEKNRKASWNF